jgi:hypothetical protein
MAGYETEPPISRHFDPLDREPGLLGRANSATCLTLSKTDLA